MNFLFTCILCIWYSNADGQPTTRKPTIDKEFEQHFSMLML